MSAYTNLNNISLSMAVWLAHDNYDHDPRNNHISATGLLKSTRQIILATRVPPGNAPTDIASLIPSRVGSAVHDGIEQAWVNNYKSSMALLGYPQRVIDRVVVNPDPDAVGPDDIPVYLEQRGEKEIDGYIISGKFDFVAEGGLEDFKTTSVYTYMHKTKDKDYILQGSIYRVLHPKIITKDSINIQFLFNDWSQQKANVEKHKGYPQSKVLDYRLPLMSVAETEHWIRNKLAEIRNHISSPDEEIPECNSEELWRKDPVFKYYKNPEKKGKSTKNFDSYAEAHKRLADDGFVGEVVEVKGGVVACRYCDAFSVCKQKDKYIASGELII